MNRGVIETVNIEFQVTPEKFRELLRKVYGGIA
jgi:hypothetical protein